MASYQDTADRWCQVVLGRTTKNTLTNRRMPIRGDHIFSYGSHFEIARLLRDRKGAPVAFLLNGETFSNTTTKHQAEVRNAVGRTGMPRVTIPYRALNAAGIDFDSIQLVDVQSDWWETIVTERAEFPAEAEWVYEHETLPGTGVHVHRDTGQVVHWTDLRPDRPRYGEEGHRRESWDEYYQRVERWDHSWIAYPIMRRNTGRKVIRNKRGWRTWEMVDDGEGGIVYRQTFDRHRLGGSLIRARVNYQARRRCVREVAPWVETFGEDALGPLTEYATRWRHDFEYSEPDWEGPIRPRTVAATWVTTVCPTCNGTGWRRERATRWAYFLSGFDENETRPSYFFCELMPGVRPTTVGEALDSLKPDAVRFAESIGREVKRQGDIFAIPMPGVTLRELKQRGGVHTRRPKPIERDGRLVWDGPRPQLLGTNHEGTEIVAVGRELYARGSIRHVPGGRRPDHKLVPLGKEWHLIVKNTVPISGI